MPLLRQLPVCFDNLLLICTPEENRSGGLLFGWQDLLLVLEPNWSDWLPADAEDLVVISLPRDFEQFLGSLEAFSYLLVVVKLSRLLVVLHS